MKISIKAAALLLGAWMPGTTAPAEEIPDGPDFWGLAERT